MAKEDPINLRTKIFSQYGDIARLKIKGITNYYLSHPDYVKHVLKDNEENYFYRHPLLCDAIMPFGGRNSLFVDNDPIQWYHDRITANISFDPNVYFHDYTNTIVGLCDTMLNQWQISYKDNEYINAGDQIDTLVVPIVAHTLFTKVEIDHVDILSALVSIPDLVKKRLSSLPFLWYFLPARRKYLDAAKHVNKLANDAVVNRLDATTQWDDILYQFCKENEGASREEMIEYLSNHLITFFIVGFFTTSSLIHWALIELSRHPDVERKIAEEVNRIIGNRMPTYDDIKSLKYLSSVIKEVLRLHPVTFAIMRQANLEDTMGEFYIPPKAGIIISAYHVHRHPEFWPNPEGFDPERFIDNPLGQNSPFAYIPFGVDKRKCPGSSFSMLEATLVIAMLVRRFYLDLPANSEVKSKVTTLFTMRPNINMFRLRHKK